VSRRSAVRRSLVGFAIIGLVAWWLVSCGTDPACAQSIPRPSTTPTPALRMVPGDVAASPGQKTTTKKPSATKTTNRGTKTHPRVWPGSGHHDDGDDDDWDDCFDDD
jgi:hypothetical protein